MHACRHGHRNRVAGFTLIELLVVISIIALLVSILLPSLAEAKRNAEFLRCASNIRQGTIAFHRYFGDNKDWMPPLVDPAQGITAWGYNYGNWYSRLRPYCTLTRQDNGNLVHEQPKEFQCPSKVSGVYAYGRSTLPFGTNWLLRFRGADDWGKGTRSWRLDEFRSATETGLLLDMLVYYDALRFIEHWQAMTGGYIPSHMRETKHDARGTSVSYMDGHAQFIRIKRSDLKLTYGQAPDYYPMAHARFWGWLGGNNYVHSWAQAYTPYDY